MEEEIQKCATHHRECLRKIAVVRVLGLPADDIKCRVGDTGIRSILRGKIQNPVRILADPDSFLRALVFLKCNSIREFVC